MSSIEFIERFSSKNNITPSKNETKLELANKLTHLYMNGKFIDKIGDLTACPKLKVLYLYNNNISRIENISSLQNLTHLYLQWNRIKKIENLNSLKNLKKLYLGNNEIKCLENLEGLLTLEELHIERQMLNGEEFIFTENCFNNVSKTLKVLNISNLNLKSLKPIEGLYLLEDLIATENKFEVARDLGVSLGFLPHLYKTDLYNCPAQRNVHYREQITAGAYQLQTLDGKDISRYTRTFIKNFEQKKIERKSKHRLMDGIEEEREKINLRNSISVPSLSFLNFQLDGDDVGYRTWQSLQPGGSNKSRVQSVKNRRNATAKCCKREPNVTDVILQGTTVVQNK